MEQSTGKKVKISGISSPTQGQFRAGNTTDFENLLETRRDWFLQFPATPLLTNHTIDLSPSKKQNPCLKYEALILLKMSPCVFLSFMVTRSLPKNLHECTKVCALHLYPVIMKCIII